MPTRSIRALTTAFGLLVAALTSAAQPARGEDAPKTLITNARVFDGTSEKLSEPMSVLVEGHTDNVPIGRECFKDNWDLSVSRAVTITRVLQNDYKVDPARITAAGRSEYLPLVGNDTPDGRSRNRRIRIVILPKMDQFFGMIEDGLKKASGQ